MQELLIKARQEILALRQQNEMLGVQVDVVAVFAAALGLKRHDERPMTEDIAWKLQKEIDQYLLNSEDQNERSE